MHRATLFPVVILGAFTLSPAATRADPDQHNAPTVAAVPSPPSCLRVTGSRIPQKATECAGFGRSYSEQDLNQTGLTSVGDALGHLDPSITVRK